MTWRTRLLFHFTPALHWLSELWCTILGSFSVWLSDICQLEKLSVRSTFYSSPDQHWWSDGKLWCSFHLWDLSSRTVLRASMLNPLPSTTLIGSISTRTYSHQTFSPLRDLWLRAILGPAARCLFLMWCNIVLVLQLNLRVASHNFNFWRKCSHSELCLVRLHFFTPDS